MNSELERLLREAGAVGDFGWQDVVMLYNYAPIPQLRAEGTQWGRGFNLALLARGRPEFFVKCRPAGESVVQRETAVRTCLTGHLCRGLAVAPARLASSDRLTVQVSPFLRGPHYGRIVRRQSRRAYLDTLRTVLEGNAELSSVALRECPTIRYPSTVVSLAAATAETLPDAASLAKLEPRERAALSAVVRDAGLVPCRPQHGDFWWQNLIMFEGRLWAIDFDNYGELSVPLFDDITLVLSTIGARSGGTVEGLARLLSDDDEAQGCKTVLSERAVAEHLHVSQLDGTFVHYLVYMASNVHRRGGIGFSEPHLEAVRYVAARLAAGERELLAPR